MSPQDQLTERLNAAIDALVRGAPLAEACADLPAELHGLAAAGARLAAARAAAPEGLRPSFVLELEEQLRADLRLGRAEPPEGPPGPGANAKEGEAPRPRPLAWPWAARALVAGLVVLGLSGIWSGAERSAPGDRLYSAKRAIEAVRLFAALSPESKAEACLDIGWRRLEEAGRVIREGRTSELAALVEDMSTAYTLALTYAERAGSRRIDHLAQSETRLAFDEVTRLAAQAGPPAASLLARVNLVLSGTSQGRRIVAVTIPQPTALARPTQLALIPGASPTPGATAEGSPGAAATVSPAAPPATSPTAQSNATTPPRGATPSATSPASPLPPASPTAAASPSPAAPVPPPSATPIRPKPVRPTATATALPPTEEPSRTPKPWATDTPPPTAAPPTSRPSATPDPSIPPPSVEPPSVEPPSPGLP